MSRFVRTLCCTVLLITGTACNNDGNRTPATGRYAYLARHPVPETDDSLRLSGVLVISYSTPDSIAGRWEVEQLQPELRLGRWERDAYVVYADPIYPGTIVHRIWRTGEPQQLRCEGHFTWIASGGVEQDLPLTCELSLIDTDTAGVSPEASPPMYPYTAPLPTDSPLPQEP